MLNSVNLNDRTYEDMLAEAMSHIPLYSSEWTNFNQSDPGVTILQNLTSFNALQQSYINEVTEEVRRSLLRLLGYEAAETRASRVLLKSLSPDRVKLPAQARIRAGDLSFETEAPVTAEPWGLSAVYTERNGQYRDVTYLLDRSIPAGAPVFGTPAETGAALCCILDALPEDGGELILYAHVQDAERRNPFREDAPISFADIGWQCYTADGWKDIPSKDATHGFLENGEIRLALPEEPAVFEGAPVKGCAVRCLLKSHRYDVSPRLHALTANLFEVVQKETHAKTFVFPGNRKILIDSQMTEYENLFVYCREEAGGPYRAYSPYTGRDQTGRYFTAKRVEGGLLHIRFSKKRFGYGPDRTAAAVRVTLYSEEMLHHRYLGALLGYDDQSFDIDFTKRVLTDDFSLIARIRGEDGLDAYEFVRPGGADPDGLGYLVLSEEGRVVVTNPGVAEDCELYLGDLAVTAGGEGNVREENRFVCRLGESGVSPAFLNPAAGTGGTTRETAEQLRRRFASDMRKPTAAVLASDYREIVEKTPGLCIHKVNVVADAEKSIVKISIKPYTEGMLPVLSPLYLEQIARWIEPKRMITSRVELIQPRYIPIDVKAAILVKSYFDNARAEIEAFFRRELDFVTTDRGFGEVIVFTDLYSRLEALPCVMSVSALSLLPQSRGDVKLVGADIHPGNHCLCYAGALMLDIGTQGPGMRGGR